MTTEAKNPEGIGGWLILVVIGMVVSPIRIALLLTQIHLPMFSDGTWAQLTTPSTEVYHGLWAPLIIFEVAGNLVVMLLGLAALVLLLMKSRHTPTMTIAWLLTAVVFGIADFVLADQIPLIAAQPLDVESAREIARSIVAAAIWIPYFLVSKRVKATFVRDWPARSSAHPPLESAG